MSQITPGSVTSSTQGFLTAVIANSALLFVEVGLFLVLKQRLQRIYSPRTYLPPPDKRSAKLPPGPWKWLPALLNSRAEDIIDKNGLDAYMFLRFLKMLVWIFLVFTVLTFAVIVPVDMIGQSGATSNLEKISWINVIDPQEQKRFTAHIIVVYILTIFVIYLIRREMSYFVLMRQCFLLSPSHSRLAQARTVLITSVPETLSTESSLRQFASFVPGGVERVWLYRDTKRLNEVFSNREKTCLMLEKAVSEVLRNAVRVWRKKKATRKKKRKRAIPKASEDEESRTNAEETSSDDEELLEHDPSLQLLDELVPHEKRPKHRTGALGVLGKKVDTIEWCRVSHILAQCVSYHQVLQMNDKFIETHPDDIVWHNLDDDALETRSKVSLSWLATTALIVLWSFPVAAIGGLSNIYAVCKKAEWLGWICRAPAPLPSIIQGFLPPALLAALFAMMPVILRGLAWYEGLPRHSLISVSLYRRFFLFLLIHGFLIVTLSSGLTKVTQGLAGAGSALAQLFPLVGYYFGKWFLGRTPRQAFNVTFLMPSADFGTLLPRLSLLATIGLAYSVLNPLINLLALICFGCYYIAWKFLFLQVFDQPTARESGGGYFPMATSNLFVGLYIEQICLACLFFMKVSIADSRYFALAQGVLMLVLVVITIWAHVLLNRSFAPLAQYLPMSLATKNLADRLGQDGEVDLFSNDFIQNLRKRMGKQPDRKQFDTFATRMRNDLDFSTPHGGDLEAGNNNSSVTSTTAPNTTTAQSSSDDSTASRRSETLPTNVNKAESQGDNNPTSSEDSLDEHAFDHPSTYVAQPCVWIPRDPLGLSTVIVEYLEEAGVRASDEGAIMDAKGAVMVMKPPPESTSTS
ncbi:DUF221 family protein [Lentinula edodes]|nr:DUF221 family protein [Lentinula edodes]